MNIPTSIKEALARLNAKGEDQLTGACKAAVERGTSALPRDDDSQKMAVATLGRQIEVAFWAGAQAERTRAESAFVAACCEEVSMAKSFEAMALMQRTTGYRCQ